MRLTTGNGQPVKSRHGRRAKSRTGQQGTGPRAPRPASALSLGRVAAAPLLAAGSNGRFEILPELAILTSDILGSENSITLVEKVPTSVRAATSVTRQGPHPGGNRRPICWVRVRRGSDG